MSSAPLETTWELCPTSPDIVLTRGYFPEMAPGIDRPSAAKSKCFLFWGSARTARARTFSSPLVAAFVATLFA